MTLRLTEEEYAALKARMPGTVWDSAGHRGTSGRAGDGGLKRGKYGNRRVTVDGLRFDSQREADYYTGVLLPLYRAGALRLLIRQAPFDLPGGIRYIADFVTVDRGGTFHVIDVKSEATRKNRVYINKKKQMKALWGIEIEEV